MVGLEDIMLIIKAYVNHDEIDEIWVHNIATIEDGICEYRIEKPTGYEDINIWHRRSEGWKALTLKVLGWMAERDEKNEFHNEGE